METYMPKMNWGQHIFMERKDLKKIKKKLSDGLCLRLRKNFLKAARLGNADAMFAVGFYYMGFERVKKIDYQKVVQWYIKSFETDGNQVTANMIGIIYENGKPKLKPDLKEAEKWYEIAQSEKGLGKGTRQDEYSGQPFVKEITMRNITSHKGRPGSMG